MESSKFNYTDERNVQIVIALLKAHGIHRVIASPGTTNMTFVVSIQNDPWFQIWSSVDERSAAYLACGMAAETGEPVVISCTGATASRNYMPGLTEAFYRKLPVLAITSTRGNHRVGHLVDQQIDRRCIPNDIAVESVTIPLVKDRSDERYCEIEANKAILALSLNGGGPAHINLYTNYSKNFSVREIPRVNAIYRHTVYDDSMPELPTGGHIAIFVGAHPVFSERLTRLVDKFCAVHDAVVFCDHTSGYKGKYEVHAQLLFGQKQYSSELKNVNLCIHIGEVSGSQYLFQANHIWRVSPDGQLRDTWGKLRRVFMMSEEHFFDRYSEGTNVHTGYLDALKTEISIIESKIPELPFGNIWVAQHTIRILPSGCEFHMGIYNSLRSWNFFNLPSGIGSKCNVGGFGIDGGLSTMIGASLVNPEKLYIGVFGDLAFFYDMNVLGNRHVGKNVRIMLINNGLGTEFRNYAHPCFFLGEEADNFVAAAGHYGNMSPVLVKHYVTDLGYEYISANNKETFEGSVKRFLSMKDVRKPMVFEVFTERQDESNALEQLLNVQTSIKYQLVEKSKKVLKNILGENSIRAIRK